MPVPWVKEIRKTGQLTVFNKAFAWSGPVAAAIKSFNTLGFSVKLVEVKDEKTANVVLVSASGPSQYTWDGTTVKTRPTFKPDGLHGQCSTIANEKPHELVFVAVFLPGRLTKATPGQKEVVVCHELIHACGLDDHDSEGIMFDTMKEENGGLIEYLPISNAKPMPAIRVGVKTMCKMKMLWGGGPSCN